MTTFHDITRLLGEAEAGDAGALDELMSVVYADLERMARSHLKRQFGSSANAVTLEPAALVNETFMRLIKQRTQYDNRGHFFAIATRLMFRTLIDYRRRGAAAKRGGNETRLTLVFDPGDAAAGTEPQGTIELEELQDALTRLERMDPRKADIVKMRIVWSLSVPEIAASMDLSTATVEREWRFAKAWLADEIGSPPTEVPE